MTRSEFQKPHPVQFSGSRLARWILRRLGWTVKFDGLPALQGVLAVYPHTSNWDFVVLILVKWAVGIPARFWGKHKLFRIPLFGTWLSWLGGVPVERTSPRGVVGQAVDQLVKARSQGQYFWLALAPEGTRKRIPGWRSGFYQTTLQAGVPLGLVRLDYRKREVAVTDFLQLTGDETADFKRIARTYEGVVGCIPGNAAPIQLMDASVPRAETIVK
jgi:1-acyl-sn-glycerol-3-phosphate acyltransferase